jgi:centrosomal protein CEP290
MASFKIESLQKSLAESVPASRLEEANREFADLTAKYRDLMQREQVLNSSFQIREKILLARLITV